MAGERLLKIKGLWQYCRLAVAVLLRRFTRDQTPPKIL
jgi:hypothetical protein